MVDSYSTPGLSMLSGKLEAIFFADKYFLFGKDSLK